MSLLAQIAIFLAAAVIAIPIFRRFKLGSVLGYLAAGIIIGPACFGLDQQDRCHPAYRGVRHRTPDVRHRPGTAALAPVGDAQAHLRIGTRPRCWRPRSAIGAAAYFGFGQTWQSALVIGFGLSMSSTALVLQLLAERGQLNSQYGRSAFSILLFQDIAVLPALALLPLLGVAAARTAGPGGWLALKFVAVLAHGHHRRPLCAAPHAAHRRRDARRRGLHGGGPAGRHRNRAARQPGGAVAVAGRLSRRRIAGGQRIPPRARGRHRAVQGPAARPVLHHRRHVGQPGIGAREAVDSSSA